MTWAWRQSWRVVGNELSLCRASDVPDSAPPMPVANQQRARPAQAQQEIVLQVPAGWNAAKHCRVHGAALSSGTISAAVAPVLADGNWTVTPAADWPVPLTALLVAYLSDDAVQPHFHEAFLVDRSSRTISARLTPPATVAPVGITAFDAVRDVNVQARVTVFGSRRQALSQLAERCLTAADNSGRAGGMSALVVTCQSDAPRFRLAQLSTPADLSRMEVGSTILVSAEADGYLPATESFLVSGPDLRIPLVSTTSLLVTVEDPREAGSDADPIEFGLSRKDPGSTTGPQIQQRKSRECLFSRLEPGQISVAVSRGRRWAQCDVELKTGFNAVQLRLPADDCEPILRVNLADAVGNALSGLKVTARSPVTGRMQELAGTGGCMESWSAHCLAPLELMIFDPWGRVAQSTDDPIVVQDPRVRLQLRVIDAYLGSFVAVRIHVDPKLVKEVVYSVWAHRRAAFVHDATSDPLEFHAASAVKAPRGTGWIEAGELPQGTLVVRAIGSNGVFGPAREVPIDPRQAIDGAIDVELETPGAAVARRVVTFQDAQTGKPLQAGLRVMMDRIAYSGHWLTLREGGLLTVDNLSAGTYGFSFVDGSYSPADGQPAFYFDAGSAQPETVFEARQGGRATCTIKFEDNAVAWIQAEPTDLEIKVKPERYDVGTDGVVTLNNLREGTYRIGVARRDGANVAHVLRLHLPAGKSSYRAVMTDVGWKISKYE